MQYGKQPTWSYVDLVRSGRLGNDSVKVLRDISQVADSTSTKIYLVGGMVREIVSQSGQITTSPDVTVIGEAASFAHAVTTNTPGCVLVSTSQHHTAKIRIDHIVVDIASARTDTYSPWGSLPKITLVEDIALDLTRRDFSINSMAMPLQPEGLGSLIDPFNGISDVENGILRAIRQDSFHEDPIRIMRGARLAARYNYQFDQTTKTLITEALHGLDRMTERSPQRVFNEFRIWFEDHENLDALLDLATQQGLLQALGINTRFPRNTFQRISANESALNRFAAFAYMLPAESSSSLSCRLLMPSDWTETAIDAATARSVANRCRHLELTDTELYHSLIDVQPSVIQTAIVIENDSSVTDRLQDFQTLIRHIRPELNGEDLIDLGVEQGPMIGKLLGELLNLRIERKISSVDEERQHVVNRLNDG